MKNIDIIKVGLLVLVFGISGCGTKCNTEDTACYDERLSGKWKAVEYYISPGDMNVVWQEYEKEWTITFKPNYNFESSRNFCDFKFEHNKIRGKYTDDGRFETNCHSDRYGFFFNEDNELIIYLPCIEPCWYKFEKIY